MGGHELGQAGLLPRVEVTDRLSRTSRSVVSGSGLLLGARIWQAAAGVAALALTTRSLHAGGFGNFATAFAVVSILSGVAGYSLSDAGVVGTVSRAVRSTSFATALVGGAVSLSLVLADHIGPAMGAAACSIFAWSSIATSGRSASARRRNNARGLATAQIVGSVATVTLAAVLVAAQVTQWEVFLLAYAAQPIALFLLPRDLRTARQAFVAPARVRFFLGAQVGWVLAAQTGVLLLRAFEGASSAGRYAAIIRLLDVGATVGPLMGTLALPAFVRLIDEDDREEAVRLNLLIAVLGTAVLASSVQFGWLGWRLLYGHLPFPATVFSLVAFGYMLSAATGLPDRLLQASSRAGVVARYALGAAALAIGAGVIAVITLGISGAAFTVLITLGGVNVAMLAHVGVSHQSLVRHGWLAAIAATAAGGVLVQHSSPSIGVSCLIAAVLCVAISLVWRAR